MDQERPRVNKLILQVVENQLMEKKPPEAAETLDRLINEGYTEEDAKHLIGCAIVAEMRHVVESGKPFAAERYLELLQGLPRLPHSRD